MKTIIKISMAFAFVGFLMTSCGGSEICQCVEAELAFYKEKTELDKQHREVLTKKFSGKKDFTDAENKEIKELNEKFAEKSQEIGEKHAKKRDKCRALGKDMSDEELRKMQQEYKKCSAYEELQKY
jgi:hypothetical protein